MSGADSGQPRPAEPGLADVAFFYFGLLMYTGTIASPFRVFGDASIGKLGESDPVISLCQTGMLGVLTIIFAVRRQRLLPLLRHIKPYLVLVALCLVSFVWSDFPMVTVRRGVTLAMSVLFGVYCYDTFGLARVARMLETLAILLGLISVAAYVAMPAVGVDSSIEDYTAMRGVFLQKNLLAEFMLLAIGCNVFRFSQDRRFLRFAVSMLMLMGFITMSHSASSAVVAMIVLGFGVLFMLRSGALRLIYTYLFVSASVALVTLFLLDPGGLFEALGRDPSLTGRVPLWAAMLRIIAERPWLGHGFGGFWVVSSPDVQYLWLQFPWQPPGSHDGYLDMMVDLGAVGLAVLVWILLFMSYRTVTAMMAGTLPTARLVWLFMVIVICMNLDETVLANVVSALLAMAMLEINVWAERQNVARALAWRRYRAAIGLPGLAEGPPVHGDG